MLIRIVRFSFCVRMPTNAEHFRASADVCANVCECALLAVSSVKWPQATHTRTQHTHNIWCWMIHHVIGNARKHERKVEEKLSRRARRE